MYRLQVKSHFDAAHRIKDYVGKCSRLHGHRWEVEVALEGEVLDGMNILVDFSSVKDTMEGIIEEYLDHRNLNETLDEPNVTAEFLSRWFFHTFEGGSELAFIWPDGVRLARVTVWESPDCCVKYYGED